MKGGIGWKLITSALDCELMKVIFDVPVSRKLYEKVSNSYKNSYIYNFV